MRLGAAGKVLLVLLGLGILAFTWDRYLGERQLQNLLLHPKPTPVELSAGDFPAGAAAPAGDLAALPPRPLRIAGVIRGSLAPGLLLSGEWGHHPDSPASRVYGVEMEMVAVSDGEAATGAVAQGGDRGGADGLVVSVDRLAQLRREVPSARLKTVLLVARSRGGDVVAAGAGIDQVAELKGKKVAVAPSSSRYLLFWSLAQAQVPFASVELVKVPTVADGARLLREGRVDAAAGPATELAGAAKERAGKIIASTADAPHLVALVLAMRGDALARWPDGARRVVRGMLESADTVSREPLEAARLLAAASPQIGDPSEAIRDDPPASLADNLAFFGVKGDAPVRYEELYASAAALWLKLGEPADASLPVDTRELGPLLSVAASPPVK